MCSVSAIEQAEASIFPDFHIGFFPLSIPIPDQARYYYWMQEFLLGRVGVNANISQPCM